MKHEEQARLAVARPIAAAKRSAISSQAGVALVLALLALGLVSVIGGAVVLLATVEMRLGTSEHRRLAARGVAEVQLERVLQDLARAADWNAVLAGVERSTFVGSDERPTVAGWGTLDLPAMTARLSRAGTEWGVDTPRWRLYAHGRASDLLSGESTMATYYAAAWVADDEADGDGRPEVDSNGLLAVRVEAFGPGGGRQFWLATIRRIGDGVQLVSLRGPP